MTDDTMPFEAEQATNKEWSEALQAIRKMRADKTGPAKVIRALYEYGEACYKVGRDEANENKQVATTPIYSIMGFRHLQILHGQIRASHDGFMWVILGEAHCDAE